MRGMQSATSSHGKQNNSQQERDKRGMVLPCPAVSSFSTVSKLSEENIFVIFAEFTPTPCSGSVQNLLYYRQTHRKEAIVAWLLRRNERSIHVERDNRMER